MPIATMKWPIDDREMVLGQKPTIDSLQRVVEQSLVGAASLGRRSVTEPEFDRVGTHWRTIWGHTVMRCAWN